MQISFNILGPLTAELRTDESDAHPTELDPGPFKQRLLLGLLLCRCNKVVPVEELIDTLWWDGPPRTAHKNLQIYISHLRKLLTAAGRPGRLLYRPSGYQLVPTSVEVDVLRFEDMSRAGRLALRRRDVPVSAATMRQALGLWRGPALADLQVSPVLHQEAARLDDRRLSVYEDWFEAELLLGNHAEVLEEIEAVVRAHPLRERLRSHQLTALYRGGRQAEALAEYDNLRQMLTSELGLDPSPALQQLYHGILSGHPALSAPPLAPEGDPPEPPAVSPGGTYPSGPFVGEVVAHLSDFPKDTGVPGGRPPERPREGMPAARPSGLPRAVDDFNGRQDVLGELLAFFRHGASAQSHLRRFAAVVGPPGAGTSTLALQAGHALAPSFRDGAILLPLSDEKGAPRPPAELIDDLLSGLDGFSRFSLGVFTEDEALDLLSRLIGTERVSRARPAALRIVRACGLLPLAVRIAGARLAGLDDLPLERFAARLEDEDRLLDELAIGDLSIRDRFDRYLQGLDTAERLALMLVAATWGAPSRGPCEMEQLLERLVGVHALTITDRGFCSAADPRPFAMPAPLWVYAQQLVGAAIGDARPSSARSGVTAASPRHMRA